MRWRNGDEPVAEIQELLCTHLQVEAVAPEEDLLGSGLLDSLSLVQLLVQLEERFAIKIPLDELQIEDIQSISAMARLVAARLQNASGSSGGDSGEPQQEAQAAHR
jgi:acyl carrier protein